MRQERRNLLDRYRSIVRSFKSARVLIVGDFVGDIYLYGRIDRISREAPVLILLHQESVMKAGCAANSAVNIRTLGGESVPVGAVGDDETGKNLLRIFRNLGIDTSGIVTEKEFPTAVKMRILAGTPHSDMQQVLRVDRPSSFRHNRSRTTSYLRSIRERLKSCDAMLVSDYALGFVRPELLMPALETANSLGRITTMDSRQDLLLYPGVTAATPNQPELETLFGREVNESDGTLERAGRRILSKLRSRALLVTRGNRGMALMEPRRKTLHIPVFGSTERVDVTGAGDTVISTFTLALAAGATFPEAARIANYAGGLKVMKTGTATICQEELLAAMEEDLG